jgi:4-diphosphocytidyl-2-C-methyl-D-erythritol kinase
VIGRAAASRAPRGIRIETRAKLNLGLAVGPRRPDGFHDLATIFQSVSLADTLEVRPRVRGFTLRVRYQDASVHRQTAQRRGAGARPRLPRGAANLVLRAARLTAREYALPGAAFRLTKRIPVQAGLGGGSADAAAAIAGLLRLYRVRLAAARRLALAAAIGSDVPFAILGGTALGLGRGERLTTRRLARPFRAIIAMPEWKISTAEAFDRLDRTKYSLTGWKSKLRFAQSIARDEVSARDAVRLGNAFENVLEDRSRAFASLCGRLRACGLEHPRLTGSGSAVFGIVPARITFDRVVSSFTGNERLFTVRSRSTSMQLTMIR